MSTKEPTYWLVGRWGVSREYFVYHGTYGLDRKALLTTDGSMALFTKEDAHAKADELNKAREVKP